MFSFHKPKIYRSNLGCCICKAKSSSSRFTDSKKYETEFERCFRIEEKRAGEICNACVLLVKRWKKLSPENRITKHWHHVVDARAGPGTKLTGNRRLVGSNSSSSSSRADHYHQDSASSSNSGCSQAGGRQKVGTNLANRAEVLPLSSNQANNQTISSSTSATAANSSAHSTARRSNSFSNKARAIDTNVTTFTFGEPDHRRGYPGVGPGYSSSPSSSSSLSFAKPQSALNSSAFESVIKRFRQRQQQQQLAAERRQLNRKQRQQQQQQRPQSPDRLQKLARKHLPAQKSEESANDSGSTASLPIAAPAPGKRLKRSSESIGSISIDGVKTSSILDSSLWRKEKICCGIIFRGVYNEVVVFPKLLKPCQCRANALRLKMKGPAESEARAADQEEARDLGSPPHRATKSGSISSCDSNTSGTGSMDPHLEDLHKKHSIALLSIAGKQRRKSNLRSAENVEEVATAGCSSVAVLGLKQTAPEPSRSRVLAKRQQQAAGKRGKRSNDNDSTISSASSSAFSSKVGDIKSCSDSASQQAHSPGSSSDASSSRLLLMADDDGLILDDEDVESTDASSSVESLAEMERKKSTSSGVVGALG